MNRFILPFVIVEKASEGSTCSYTSRINVNDNLIIGEEAQTAKASLIALFDVVLGCEDINMWEAPLFILHQENGEPISEENLHQIIVKDIAAFDSPDDHIPYYQASAWTTDKVAICGYGEDREESILSLPDEVFERNTFIFHRFRNQ